MIDFSKNSELELSFLLKSEDKKVSKAAFDEVYRRFSSKIYTYILRFIKDKEKSQDLFQETFIHFYKITIEKEGIAKIGGYLLKIARNLCINSLEKTQVNFVQFERSKLVSNESTMEDKENRELIDYAISLLPIDLREVIILKEFLNYSYEEISECLGINKNSVGVILFRAKKKMREILLPFFEEFNQKEGEKYEFKR